MSNMAGGVAFHLTTAETSELVENPGGILHTVTVNTGQSGATVKLYDGPDSSHPEIANIAAAGQVSLLYDAVLTTGLTAVVAGATPPDVTIVVVPAPEYTP